MSESTEVRQWQRLKPLLAEALSLPINERPAFVDRNCDGDAVLRRELLSLLAAAEASDTPLDQPLGEGLLHALDERAGRAVEGRRLGPWRLVSLIARGGMGEVYRGERADGQYEQQVAVKLMRDGGDKGPLLARFDAERRILASLDHPNLAKLLDAGVTEEQEPYFVMELVEGEPIDQHCKRLNLAVPERLKLFRSVCLVVEYAHRQGVVHRDLKPGNILVTPQGVVKLVDFGIAKRLPGEAAPPTDETATNLRVLTPEYASPEQVRGEPVTPASDVYALGVVLYRLLADTSPYGRATTDSYALNRAICDTEPPRPSQVVPSMGPQSRQMRRKLKGDLDAVVMMALRKQPEHRYASAEAMADDIFRHLEGLPVQARRGAWSYRAGRFVLRHRAAVGAALVANLALVAGVSFAAYQAFEANRQKERAERHFASVRKLANVFIFDVHNAIEPLTGATPARKLIVQNALNYLEQLSAEAQQQVDLQVELATAYRQIGDIQGGPFTSNLGDPKGASASYARARSLTERALERGADASTKQAARKELATTTRTQAALMASQGDFKGALAAAQVGIDAAHAMQKAEPASPAGTRMLAGLQASRAQILQFSGDHEGFLKASAEAIALLETLHRQNPDDAAIGGNLASMYGMRSHQRLRMEGTPAAAALSRQDLLKCIEVLEALLKKHPDHGNLVANLAVAYDHLGGTSELLDRMQDSVAERRKAVKLLEPMLAKDPDNVMLRIDHATFTGELAQGLLHLGQVEESVAAAQQALKAFDSVPEAARSNLVSQLDHGFTHFRLAQALDARAALAGRPAATRKADGEAACRHFRAGAEMFRAHEARFGPQPTSPMKGETMTKALARCA